MTTRNAAIPGAGDLENKLLQTATEWQQDYYEICSDLTPYEKDQHAYLRDYIGYALFGPKFGEFASNDSCSSNEDFNQFLYLGRERKAINLIFEKVTEHGINEESNGTILCGIMYNVIYKKPEVTKRKKKEHNGDETRIIKTEPQVHPVPVFKIRAYESRKRGKRKENQSKNATKYNPKIYYIDNDGRVYKGFTDYLANNTLPRCTMVLPKDGRYQADPEYLPNNFDPDKKFDTAKTKVWIEVHDSPASKVAAKVLMGGDIVSSVVTFASVGVCLAAAMTPVGAGIALAGAVGAGVSGLWSAGRCAQQLADRGNHGESINVTNKNALGAWIGIAGGTMGLAATGGTVLLARAVRTGAAISKAAIITHDAVQIGNMIVNGVGVGFKFGIDISAGCTGNFAASAKDVQFLTAHAFFFFKSVINVRVAQSTNESTQGQFFRDYESGLRSNRHRREVERLGRNERIMEIDEESGNEETVRAITRIDNEDEFFQAMVRNRKVHNNASGARASFSSGQIVVDGVMTIDPLEFASLSKGLDFVESVKNVRSRKSPLKILISNDEVSLKKFTDNCNTVLKQFCLNHRSCMMQSAYVRIDDFAEVLGDLCSVRNKAVIFLELLEVGDCILRMLPQDEELTFDDTLALVVQFLWDYLKWNLRKNRPGMMFEDPVIHTLLNEFMRLLACRVESNLDDWVKAFVKWLITKFPQSLNWPIFQSHELA